MADTGITTRAITTPVAEGKITGKLSLASRVTIREITAEVAALVILGIAVAIVTTAVEVMAVETRAGVAREEEAVDTIEAARAADMEEVRSFTFHLLIQSLFPEYKNLSQFYR